MRSTKKRLLLLGMVLLAAGCGRSKGADAGGGPAEVSGRVWFNGQPLPGGMVRFMATGDESSASVLINPDGTYRLRNVPVGKVKICVDTSPLRRLQATPIHVPEKYWSFKKTDLTYKVRPGPQTYDIRIP